MAVVTSVLLASCTGGTTTSTPPQAASEADVVAWLDQVCGAVGGTTKAMSGEPSIDLSDPAKLKAGLSEWLGGQVSAADRSVNDLKALENGPHPRSKELAGAAENDVTQFKALLTDTRSKIDSSGDATAVVTAFSELMTKAAAFENTGADMRKRLGDSGMGEAAEKAAKCRELDASASSRPTS
ncbi:hypothetical protein ADL03_39825 [Nocardia sp. NRRL S-836]|nr:hypothetical protein ADL03_39825 [Nocardia sp. NRRL S-836]